MMVEDTVSIPDKIQWRLSRPHYNCALNIRAQNAIAMIDRWGMVAGIPDGEDSSGRQKLRLAEPAELVYRACETSRIAMERFNDLGWLINHPLKDDKKDLTVEYKNE